jgi:5'-nucleotidase
MNILLTNDDGIKAEGIHSLYEALSRHHSVFMIAPDSEKSACSNAITVRDQLTIKKISENKFSVTGFPSDCVIIGLSGDIIPDVGLVVSGINHGPNVGDDLIFSGTVAAARTGYIFGKDAIAVSINSYHRASQYMDDAAMFVLDFVNIQMPDLAGRMTGHYGHEGEGPAPRVFFNINYPDLDLSRIKGKKFTHLGKRIYRDSFQKTNFDYDEAIVRMEGYIESVFAEGSDTTELDEGYISITPLMVDSTNYSALKKIIR